MTSLAETVAGPGNVWQEHADAIAPAAEPKMRIIGIAGPAGSGKDTAAQMVIEDQEPFLSVERQGFADKLKLSFARIFYPHVELEAALAFCNDLKVDHNLTVSPHIAMPSGDHVLPRVTGREALQHYGTEAHRDVFGDDFWLDAVLPEGRNDCDLLVIPDVRFPNEAERVRSRGGQLWHIERPDQEAVKAHSSESGLEREAVDYVIYNRGSIEDLRTLVEAALRV